MILIALVVLVLQGVPQASTGSIAGQILSANGTPAPSVRVALMPVDAQAGQKALQDLSAFCGEQRLRHPRITPIR